MVLRRFIENEKYEKKYLTNLVRDESNLQSSSSELLPETELEDEGIQLADEKKSSRKSSKTDESTSDDDLTRFLKALNLGHLQAVFDAEKIKMKDLLRFSFSDLTQVRRSGVWQSSWGSKLIWYRSFKIGIQDGPAKKLLSDEIRKLSLRCFSSGSLIPLRHDPTVK